MPRKRGGQQGPKPGFVTLTAPGGEQFQVNLVLTKHEYRNAKQSIPKAVTITVQDNVITFLNQVSMVLYSTNFNNLDLTQRGVVWDCIKESRQYNYLFLNELLLIMDSMFAHSVTTIPQVFSFDPQQLRSFCKYIFLLELYLTMNITERRLLREFLVKTKGNIHQMRNVTNTEVENLVTKVKLIQMLPPNFDLNKDVECDLRLNWIVKEADVTRFDYLLEQQAREDYNSGFKDLTKPVTSRVLDVVMNEYRVQIMKVEGREPIVLDEAAYLVYLIPYKQLSLYAQYITKRFRQVIILKQWMHLKLSQQDVNLREDYVALFGFDQLKINFMFRFAMNRFMLTEAEFSSISDFPSDFERRFDRLLSLHTSVNVEEQYLTTLFNYDEKGPLINLIPAPQLSIEPQPLSSHFVQGFAENIAVFSGAVKEKAKPCTVAEEPVATEPPADLLYDPANETTSQEYIDVLTSLKPSEKTEETAKEIECVIVEEKESEREILSFVPEQRPKMSGLVNKIAQLNAFVGKNGSMMWSKFIISSSSHVDKEELLFALTKTVPFHHNKFILYNYHVEGMQSIFYSRQCYEIVELFIRKNLVFKVPRFAKDFKMKIEVNCDNPHLKNSFYLNSFLMDVLGRQLQEHPGHINLSAFHRNPDLESTIFYALNYPSNLQNVLNCINSISSAPILSIDLSNNRISCFGAKRYDFLKFIVNFNKITTLDLRNNELNFSALSDLTALPLKKVFLDGNPLCTFYDREQDYISDVMKNWPDLESLDSCRLGYSNSPCIKQHYLVIPAAQSFVDQFLTHYFSIFDSNRRDLLSGIYHSKAILSMTCTFLELQSTSDNSYLSYFFSQSRNMKRMSDFSKINQLLCDGNRQIMEFFANFPATRHDPATFSVDVVHCDADRVQVAISGVFREETTKEVSPRYFRKLMVLVKFHDMYLIVNELMYINNCTTEQAMVPESKNLEETPIYDLYLSSIPKLAVFTAEQKLGLMKKLSDMTGMTVLWSKRCLEDVKWDLRNALIFFQSLYQNEGIPSEAFL